VWYIVVAYLALACWCSQDDVLW